MNNKSKKQIEKERKDKEYWKKQEETNSQTWYLLGSYDDTMPGGGERHPLDMD